MSFRSHAELYLAPVCLAGLLILPGVTNAQIPTFHEKLKVTEDGLEHEGKRLSREDMEQLAIAMQQLAMGGLRESLKNPQTKHPLPGSERSAKKKQLHGPGGIVKNDLLNVSMDGKSFSFDASSISSDGRFVAFSSSSDDVVPGDTNNSTDIFVRDRRSGTTARVSVSSEGIEADGDCYAPAISNDGQLVAFGSTAQNLAPDGSERYSIYLRNRKKKETIRVSTTFSVDEFAMSPDGHFILYEADFPLVRLYDTHERRLIDLKLPDQFCGVELYKFGGVQISNNGRFIAYTSGASYASDNVFLFDRELTHLQLISRAADGKPARGHGIVKMTGDGRFIAFDSDATNLVEADTNRCQDVFLYDRLDDSLERVSLTSEGTQETGDCVLGGISRDGSRVLFQADSSESVTNLFIRDVWADETINVNRYADGSVPDDDWLKRCPNLSEDGVTVVFHGSGTGYLGRKDVRDAQLLATELPRFPKDSSGKLKIGKELKVTKVFEHVVESPDRALHFVPLAAFGDVSTKFRTKDLVQNVAFSSDGETVAIATSRGIVEISNARTGKIQNRVLLKNCDHCEIKFTASDTKLVVCDDSSVWVIYVPSGRIEQAVQPVYRYRSAKGGPELEKRIEFEKLSPSGRLAAGRRGSPITNTKIWCLYETTTWRQVREFHIDATDKLCAFSADETSFLTCTRQSGHNYEYQIWDIRSGDLVEEFTRGGLYNPGFSPDLRSVISQGHVYKFRASGDLAATIEARQFSPDGLWCIGDKKLYDATDFEPLLQFNNVNAKIEGEADPSGNWIATCYRRELRLWSLTGDRSIFANALAAELKERIWTDSAASHTIVAVPYAIDTEHIWLRRADQELIKVEARDLSLEDQKYLGRLRQLKQNCERVRGKTLSPVQGQQSQQRSSSHPFRSFVDLEQDFRCVGSSGAARWPASEGGNGHFYEVVATGNSISWDDAKKLARLSGGYLATITSNEENEFVFQLADNRSLWSEESYPLGPWLGAEESVNGDSDAGWRWVSGEPFSFHRFAESGPKMRKSRGKIPNHIAFGKTYQKRTPMWEQLVNDGSGVRSLVVEFDRALDVTRRSSPSQKTAAVKTSKASVRTSESEKLGPSSHAQKLFDRGMKWLDGTAGRVDEGKAKTLFIRAAAEGNPVAKLWIAILHVKGQCGFKVDWGVAPGQSHVQVSLKPA